MENVIEKDKIRSIQITAKECIVTVSDMDSKQKMLIDGVVLKDRSVNLFEVEKSITNVIIKDAPYEMSDCVISSNMARFGEVFNGSVRRGKIKGTDRYSIYSVAKCRPYHPNFEQVRHIRCQNICGQLSDAMFALLSC